MAAMLAIWAGSEFITAQRQLDHSVVELVFSFPIVTTFDEHRSVWRSLTSLDAAAGP
jgi:hypothetical protein